jgi:MoxR-like ATPase
MLQHRTASGMILLDEIDKVGASNQSSAPATSVLLGLLEPETASRWYDTFLQTTCDFSRLSFWATANSLKSLPAPLLSRFTVLYMPEPRQEDMKALVQGITDDIAREWRLPLGALPLPPSLMYEGVRLNARELRRLILRFLSDWAEKNRSPARLH